ncbi:MAG: hypothetical protein NTZ72_04405 [Afipia sp.]|nr:hypothetical protein [Afipia sp.]
MVRAGISAVGRCRKTDLFSFAITERAVEDFCFSHNHLAAALDEEGRNSDGGATSKIKTAFLPYLIPGGRGTVRSNKAVQDGNLKNLSWALLALSTGENPIDGSSTVRPEGARVRMIGIPVQPGNKGGIFNHVEGTPNEISQVCNRLARQVDKTIADNYGVAFIEYLRRMVPRRPELTSRITLIIDNFVEKMEANVDPWERRFAEKFGIVLAGAILMSEFGIGPWTRRRARKAIEALYGKARSATISTDDATDSLMLRLRKLVGDGKRFPVVKKGSKLNMSHAWGVTRTLPGGKPAICIRLSRFRKLVKPSAISSSVLLELSTRRVLIKAANGKKTRQMMFKGSPKRRRYVCLDRSRLRYSDSRFTK